MKTAVSIPDNIFESAEKLAHRQGTSRSRLYARALKSYLESQDSEVTTRKLDGIYVNADSSLDPAFKKLQAQSLSSERW